jgi:hypothetical protein
VEESCKGYDEFFRKKTLRLSQEIAINSITVYSTTFRKRYDLLDILMYFTNFTLKSFLFKKLVEFNINYKLILFLQLALL